MNQLIKEGVQVSNDEAFKTGENSVIESEF